MLFITKRTADRREQLLRDEIESLRNELIFQQAMNMPEALRRLDQQVKDLLGWDAMVERGDVHAWDSPSLRLGLKPSVLDASRLMAVTYDFGHAFRVYLTPADAAQAYMERVMASA